MHRKNRLRLGAVVVAWLGTFGHAMNAGAVDLLGVVEQTTDHDAELAASRAGAKAALQAVPMARAALLPQLGGGWGRAYNRIAVQDYPRTAYWQNGWTVSLTQPVFDWGRWTALKQAGLVEARGALDAARAQQSSILRAVRGYFDELGAEDELTRATDYAAALDEHLRLVQRKHAGGEATVIDLREAGTALQQAQLQQLDARNDLQLKRLALEQMTGGPFVALSRLVDASGATGTAGAIPMPHIAPDDADAWATQAEAHGYDVQLKQIDWQIAKLDVEKARAGHLPTVSLTATHTPAGAGSGYARPTTTSTAMLSITIPFFEGGATRARVAESKALEDKAQDDLLAATRQANAAARDADWRFRSGAARIDATAQLAQAARASLDAVQIGYKVGSRAGTDVLRAADVFYTSRRDLIRARYDTLVALLQLQASTASLDFEAVARVNALLVPAPGMDALPAVAVGNAG